MKKKQLEPYVRSGLTALLVIFISTVVVFIIAHYGKFSKQIAGIQIILRPISLGIIYAFLLVPIYNRIIRFLLRLEARGKGKFRCPGGLRKGIAIFITFLFVFTMLYILLAMVVPQVYFSIVGLIQSIPEYITTAQNWIMGFLEDNPEIQKAFLSVYNPAVMSFEEWLNDEIIPNLASLPTTLTWLKEDILPNITGVISNVSSFLVQLLIGVKDVFIGIVVSIYLLASKDLLAAQGKKLVCSLLSARYSRLLIQETRNAYRIMSGFINGKLLDSLIIGIITLFCCNLFGFPYPALIAVIIGVTNIVPFFGPIIGAIPSAFLILLINPVQFLYFCIFVFVLQQFDGNILGPKILGDSTGLSSFWVLFSIICFGGLFGFAGMVLGVPCFAIVYSVARRLINNSLKRKNLSTDTRDYMRTSGQPEPPVCPAAQPPEAPEKPGDQPPAAT